MAKLSDDRLARLRQHRTEVSDAYGDKFIQLKDGDRVVIRILPAGPDGLPAVPLIEAFSQKLKKGATSPATYGSPCPIRDYIDQARASLSKDEFTELLAGMKTSTKYAVACIDRAEPGMAGHPIVKLLALSQVTYDKILMQMVDGDSDDITDLNDGRDVVIIREGKNLDTTYHVKFEDRSPLSDDEAYVGAVRKLLETYTIPDHFYPVDWQRLGEIYRAGTGEEIPASYMEVSREAPPVPKTDARAPAPPPVQAPKSAAVDAPRATPKPAAKPVPKLEPVPPKPLADSNGIILGVTRVSFPTDDEVVEGVAMVYRGDLGNGEQYEVRTADGVEWYVDLPDLTILAEPPKHASPKLAKPAPSSAAGKLAAHRP